MPDLIKDLQLDTLTQEEKSQVLIKITDSLLKRLIIRVYDHLTEKEQAEFDKLTSGGDSQKIDEFLKTKIPDFEKIRQEELDGLIVEMKDFLASARKK